MYRAFSVAFLVGIAAALCGFAFGEDWPTYLHDNTRGGVTSEQLSLPMREAWVYESAHAPSPAWPPPAERDIWHEIRELRPTVTFDRAYETVVAGDAVYFGSSSDDQVYCLDAATGEVRWHFFTEGPIRLAPTVADGKVYAGSDDGRVYCLNAADGALLWQCQGDPDADCIPGNGRMISSSPVRTSVLVNDGVAYFFAGLFPSQGVYRCALNAADGSELWHAREVSLSPQGYLLASPTRLFVPTGRTTPTQYELATGKELGPIEGRGGAYAVVTGDMLVTGPGRSTGGLDLADAMSRECVYQFDGLRMVVHEGVAYMQSKREVSAFDQVHHTELARQQHALAVRRKAIEDSLKGLPPISDEAKAAAPELAELASQTDELSRQMDACSLWKRPCWAPFAMILAGDTLFLGGQDEVTAIKASDGSDVWTGKVTGNAYGLTVANGNLLVSTDKGTIHCFRDAKIEREHVVQPIPKGTVFGDDPLTPFYEAAAERIVAELRQDGPSDAPLKGYCLVLGCGEGRLAYQLALRTEMQIVGVEEDGKKVATARAALNAAGLYGTRVSVHEAAKDAVPPFTSYFANLVVSDETLLTGKLPASADAVFRMVRPYGGVALIGQPEESPKKVKKIAVKKAEEWVAGATTGWTLESDGGTWAAVRRGAVPGAGEWTQLYADASHTACSSDSIEGPVQIQWFGEPGPREMIDRHHRPMSSLFKSGRVFIPANDRVIAADAYNGTLLWKLDVPNSRRVGALRNCGHMVVTDDYLYVAVENQCWAVDVVTGTVAFVLDAPPLVKEKTDWGYVDVVGDRLYGSVMKAGASLRELGLVTINTMIEGDFRPMIASEALFSMDRRTGKVKWTHKGGVVMNNTIALGEGRIYFVESRNEKAVSDEDGRLRVDHFCDSETYVIALDADSGKKLWEKPFTFPYSQMMFLNTANGILLACGTYNVDRKVEYGLFGFDTKTGDLKWKNTCQNGDGIGGSHGEQWQHPVLIGNRIFSDPFEFDLQTGEKEDYDFSRGGGGCGGLTGSLHYLYGRGSNPRMYPVDVQRTSGIQLTKVSRPGCWLNIIPAGGIIAIPESSSGCTCSYPIQTSFAFIPKAAL